MKRNARGAVLGLAVVLSVVMLILIGAFFKLSLFFGVADETRNATDAGALNVGKHSFDLNVSASSGDEHQFDDVADANKKFNLTNINRVWAKAMLANANVAAMIADNQSSPLALLHAQQLYQGAESISGKLAGELKKPENFYSSFDSISSGNNVRLAATPTSVASSKNKDWQTSYVDRGEASNIDFDPEQLPIPVPFTNPAKSATFKIPGYQAIPVLDKKFYLVSMKDNDRTHLINPENFNANKLENKGFDGWKNPVPNAFSVHGESANNNLAMSWVQVNPQYKFNLGIPHAYVKIKIDPNKARYTFAQQPLGEENYEFRPSVTSTSFTTPAQLKVTFVPVNLGNEYATANSLYDVMFPKALNAKNEHSKVLSTLLQRCREIRKGYTLDQLVKVLKSTAVDPTGLQNEFYIFPSKNELTAALASQALSQARWINPLTQADGSKKEIAHEDSIGQPNTAMFTVTEPITGASIGPIPAVTQEHGTFNWTPGSGFDGCLGELSISRTTQFPAAGVPQPKETEQ